MASIGLAFVMVVRRVFTLAAMLIAVPDFVGFLNTICSNVSVLFFSSSCSTGAVQDFLEHFWCETSWLGCHPAWNLSWSISEKGLFLHRAYVDFTTRVGRVCNC